MSVSVNSNKTIYSGETIPWEVTCKNSNDEIVDITGYTMYFTVKKVFDQDNTDANAVLQKTITALSDPTNGVFRITFDAGDTLLTSGDYKYDIQAKNTSGKLTTIQQGILTIKASATRRSNT